MTLTRPMFPPRASPTGAPGAASACPASLILESRPGASLALASEGEPHATPPTCSSGAGHSMTRRILMNMMVSAAAVVAAAEIPAAEASADTATEAGAQFERLVVEYADVVLEWARLHRAAAAAHREKFGAGYRNNLTDEDRAKFAAFEE